MRAPARRGMGVWKRLVMVWKRGGGSYGRMDTRRRHRCCEMYHAVCTASYHFQSLGRHRPSFISALLHEWWRRVRPYVEVFRRHFKKIKGLVTTHLAKEKMSTESLFQSNLDDTCVGTMYEGMACNTRTTAYYTGYSNPAARSQSLKTIGLELRSCACVSESERLGHGPKELTRSTTAIADSATTNKFRTIETPLTSSTPREGVPTPSLATQ